MPYTVYAVVVDDENAFLDALGRQPGFMALETIEEAETEVEALRILHAIDGGDYGPEDTLDPNDPESVAFGSVGNPEGAS